MFVEEKVTLHRVEIPIGAATSAIEQRDNAFREDAFPWNNPCPCQPFGGPENGLEVPDVDASHKICGSRNLGV